VSETTVKRRARQEVARCEAILANKRKKLSGVEDEVKRMRERRQRDVSRAETKLQAAKERAER
jgi:hypothetical protein